MKIWPQQNGEVIMPVDIGCTIYMFSKCGQVFDIDPCRSHPRETAGGECRSIYTLHACAHNTCCAQPLPTPAATLNVAHSAPYSGPSPPRPDMNFSDFSAINGPSSIPNFREGTRTEAIESLMIPDSVSQLLYSFF